MVSPHDVGSNRRVFETIAEQPNISSPIHKNYVAFCNAWNMIVMDKMLQNHFPFILIVGQLYGLILYYLVMIL
jgi:hypothetical protein